MFLGLVEPSLRHSSSRIATSGFQAAPLTNLLAAVRSPFLVMVGTDLYVRVALAVEYGCRSRRHDPRWHHVGCVYCITRSFALRIALCVRLSSGARFLELPLPTRH